MNEITKNRGDFNEKSPYKDCPNRNLSEKPRNRLNVFKRKMGTIWSNTLARFGDEWVFLSILGVIMALISYAIDRASGICNQARMWLYILGPNAAASYFGWIGIPVLVILFGVGFVKILSPKAAGSGIPEIKTIIRGFSVDGFLTVRTLIAKIVGLTCTLGSNLPLGKEGPLIHISSIIAKQLGPAFPRVFADELRRGELLGAACAVGVACCFTAPIGGVLLSVEITTAYYAVRNYWRGFCAAVWACTLYRLLYVWIDGMHTVTAIFKTSIFVETPFGAQELVSFAILGTICGFGGAIYLKIHRGYARLIRLSPTYKKLQQLNFFLYPFLVIWAISSVTYPNGLGKYHAGQLGGVPQILHLFSNFTWSATNYTVAQHEIIDNWKTDTSTFYYHLIFYIIFNFVASIIATTIPVPNGCFSPSLRMGAAIGRILGELLHTWYPEGLSEGNRIAQIMPGGYAIVGAAAFAGSVTQTMSVCVIMIEMTNQISHIIPILIAVLIGNAISHSLGPGMYNSVIKVKNLPYLPDLNTKKFNKLYELTAEHIMNPEPPSIHYGMTRCELKTLISSAINLTTFPLLDSHGKVIGTITKKDLQNLLGFNLTDNVKDDRFRLNPIYEPKYDNDDVPDLDTLMITTPSIQLTPETSLPELHRLFSLAQIDDVYVVKGGHLLGIIRFDDLRKAIIKFNQ